MRDERLEIFRSSRLRPVPLRLAVPGSSRIPLEVIRSVKSISFVRSNVHHLTFLLLSEVPGQPTVTAGTIDARSAVVTWSYSPGPDEMPITSFTLQYWNGTFTDDIPLPGGVSRKQLINLKPFTSYSIRIMAVSVLGNGYWSNPLTAFKTLTSSK